MRFCETQAAKTDVHLQNESRENIRKIFYEGESSRLFYISKHSEGVQKQQ